MCQCINIIGCSIKIGKDKGSFKSRNIFPISASRLSRLCKKVKAVMVDHEIKVLACNRREFLIPCLSILDEFFTGSLRCRISTLIENRVIIEMSVFSISKTLFLSIPDFICKRDNIFQNLFPVFLSILLIPVKTSPSCIA